MSGGRSRCKECLRAAARNWYRRHVGGVVKPRNWQALLTQCKRGHEFTEENTRRYRGRRHCRKCAAILAIDWKIKHGWVPKPRTKRMPKIKASEFVRSERPTEEQRVEWERVLLKEGLGMTRGWMPLSDDLWTDPDSKE
jgi:hypothetical protein